ncbi:hypothetical protein SERLA73DRAFT_70356 [Serpula lacrymans var. lacrymans S7.3]|uniref:Uncharacterized protein n=2 Tax=Serpula lacrymans var. lacrymans TaxID=341189 RepID=F8PMN4_SERL3|nr:uncharacterized protein SERLADRAFT_434480 [Serpula lacrymans var. lacrymans S7.9]EGO02866.1 hypothetical protein SERLA73DRAFT_70356 [Serpula lacrymans var. lacrymans S7.3]EGO28559.1 hypothetical protein SERLADRAFT_434480 [Serpula lacrymans var. lacrymans S7.9]
MVFLGRRSLTKAAIARTKLSYKRITLTRFTLGFFLIALANCIVQTAIQSTTLIVGSQGAALVSAILDLVPVERGFTTIHAGTLQICDNIPGQANTTCSTLSEAVSHDRDSEQNDTQLDLVQREVNRFNYLRPRGFSMQPIENSSGQVQGVNVTDPEFKLSTVTLSLKCVQSLPWLETFLADMEGEDIVVIVFQSWLFFLSTAAIITESIPHLIAVLVSHVLNTAWAGYKVYDSINTQAIYESVIMGGACNNTNVMGNWWETRVKNAIPIIIINVIFLICVAYLVFKLSKAYSQQVFGSVGASSHINGLYKLALWLYACLHLASFFTAASSALWLNRVRTGFVPTSFNGKIYEITFIVAIVLLFPWFIMGVVSVRREHRPMFFVFSLFGIALIVIYSGLFGSALFRFEYTNWAFFAATTTTSYVLLIVSCALALACRLQFGKGLAHFLWVERMLENSGFTPAAFTTDPDHNPTRFSVILDEKPTISPYASEYSVDSKGGQNLQTKPSLVPFSGTTGGSAAVSCTPPPFMEATAKEAEIAGRSKSFAERLGSRLPHILPLIRSVSPMSDISTPHSNV